MSFRTDLAETLDNVDQINGPAALDIRPTSLVIKTRTWAGGFRGRPPFTDTMDERWIDRSDTVIQHTGSPRVMPLWTKVRHLSQREIAGSGGRFEQGDVRVGPIRPAYTNASTGATGGYSAADLDPPIKTNGVENIYVMDLQPDESMTGISGEYQLVELQRDRPWRFVMVLRRRRTTP